MLNVPYVVSKNKTSRFVVLMLFHHVPSLPSKCVVCSVTCPIVDPRRLLMGCVLPDLTPRMTATIPNLYLKFCVCPQLGWCRTCHNGIMALWPANGWFQSGESCGGPISGRQPSTWSHDKTLVPASHLSPYPKNEPNRPKWTILWN